MTAKSDHAKEIKILEDQLEEKNGIIKSLEAKLKKQKSYAKGLQTKLAGKEKSTAPPRPVYGNQM